MSKSLEERLQETGLDLFVHLREGQTIKLHATYYWITLQFNSEPSPLSTTD